VFARGQGSSAYVFGVLPLPDKFTIGHTGSGSARRPDAVQAVDWGLGFTAEHLG